MGAQPCCGVKRVPSDAKLPEQPEAWLGFWPAGVRPVGRNVNQQLDPSTH